MGSGWTYTHRCCWINGTVRPAIAQAVVPAGAPTCCSKRICHTCGGSVCSHMVLSTHATCRPALFYSTHSMWSGGWVQGVSRPSRGRMQPQCARCAVFVAGVAKSAGGMNLPTTHPTQQQEVVRAHLQGSCLGCLPPPPAERWRGQEYVVPHTWCAGGQALHVMAVAAVAAVAAALLDATCHRDDVDVQVCDGQAGRGKGNKESVVWSSMCNSDGNPYLLYAAQLHAWPKHIQRLPAVPTCPICPPPPPTNTHAPVDPSTC